MDKRWHQLADVLVGYSLEVKPGERVLIAMGEVETLPLVRTVYEAVVKAGAYAQVLFLSDYLNHSLLRHGTAEQIDWLPEVQVQGMEWADVYFDLRGTHNLYELADVPAETLTAHRKTLGRVSATRWEKTRWCVTRVPNELFAQQAETDVETMMDMFFAASLRDWEDEARKWYRIADILGQGKELRLVAKETDLRFSVEGRKWLVGDGRINMPDGEIFTAPVNETLNGVITFELPGVLGGRLVHDMRLEWQDGRLTSASAGENETFLRQVLAVDEGASLLGEFAFGTNYDVDRFCKDIFFDEKIGGTIHVALGRAYSTCGGTNQSAIHWDIIKDTRQEGIVYLDGQKVLENGRILI